MKYKKELTIRELLEIRKMIKQYYFSDEVETNEDIQVVNLMLIQIERKILNKQLEEMKN